MSKVWQIEVLVWLYRHLLYLYPDPFRHTYEEEILQVFKTACQQSYAHRGIAALAWLWLTCFTDLLTNVVEEVMMNPARKRRLILILSVLFGIPAGILGGINAVTYASVVGEGGELVVFYIALVGIVALTVWAGFLATSMAKSTLTSLWVGVLIGVIAALIANTTRVAFSFAFYDFVRNEPGEIHDWLHHGNSSFVDYLIDDRIGGYIYTSLFLGLLCGIFGTLGGLLKRIQGQRQSPSGL